MALFDPRQSVGGISGSPLVLTFTALPNIAGNSIVVALRISLEVPGDLTDITITDNAGNTYTAFPGIEQAPQAWAYTAEYHAPNIAAHAGVAVTITCTPAADIWAAIIEYEANMIVDGPAHAGAIGTGLAQNSGATPARSVADTLLTGTVASTFSVIWTPGTGFTEEIQVGSRILHEYQKMTAVGTDPATATTHISTDWGITAVAYKQNVPPIPLVRQHY